MKKATQFVIHLMLLEEVPVVALPSNCRLLQLAISIFSASEFRWQPLLSDNIALACRQSTTVSLGNNHFVIKQFVI